MQINGNYNNINTNYRASESKGVQDKKCDYNNQNKQQRVDTFERSKPEDARDVNYADAYHQYVQAAYASLYNQKQEPLTPNDELKIENSKDKHSIVKNTAESCPTHNHETHSYNQQERNDSDSSQDESDSQGGEDGGSGT